MALAPSAYRRLTSSVNSNRTPSRTFSKARFCRSSLRIRRLGDECIVFAAPVKNDLVLGHVMAALDSLREAEPSQKHTKVVESNARIR
jgi:hypothetical protein